MSFSFGLWNFHKLYSFYIVLFFSDRFYRKFTNFIVPLSLSYKFYKFRGLWNFSFCTFLGFTFVLFRVWFIRFLWFLNLETTSVIKFKRVYASKQIRRKFHYPTQPAASCIKFALRSLSAFHKFYAPTFSV